MLILYRHVWVGEKKKKDCITFELEKLNWKKSNFGYNELTELHLH